MRMIKWCNSTIQILCAKQIDDESHSKLISSSNDQLRIELDFHAMTSNRNHYFNYYFDHRFDHHLKSERNQQTRRRDDWVDDVEAVWRRWNQIIVLEDEFWLMTITLNKWVDHFECMRRLSQLNENKDDYIKKSKFSHLINRQKEKFNLYSINQIRFDSYELDLHLKLSLSQAFFELIFFSSSFFTKVSFLNNISNCISNKMIVVLIKSSDWDEWILIINFMTRRSDIDEYMNLIKSKSFELVKSKMSIFSSIKSEIISFKNLIKDERRDLLMMRNNFKKMMRTFKKKFEALKTLNLHILITVDQSNLIYLMNEDTNIVFRKLTILKKRLALTNRIREMKMIQRYRDLQQFSKHQQLNRWLILWEQMYAKTTRLKLFDIQKHRVLFDFLNALRIVDDAFVIDKKMSRDKTTSIFKRVKIEANHHISLKMKSHHVISRLASCILQFVKLDRWESLTRFLHYSYYYYWFRDHFCFLSSLRDSYELDTSLANSS
jgi:hypothetical protein